MTRLISAPTETGQLRHYFIRESTLDGWRPQCGQWARLVSAPAGTFQAAVGDVVQATRTISAPGAFQGALIGCVFLTHRGGTHAVECMERDGYLVGTVGVWEHCYPIVLATWPEGSRLEQLSSEDRVAVLRAAFAELTEEEQRAFLRREEDEDG